MTGVSYYPVFWGNYAKQSCWYYENHRSVEWARITESLPHPLSLSIFMKFLSHGLKVYKTTATMENHIFEIYLCFTIQYNTYLIDRSP